MRLGPERPPPPPPLDDARVDALTKCFDSQQDVVLRLAWSILGLQPEALLHRGLKEPQAGWDAVGSLQALRALQSFTLQEADRQACAAALLEETRRLVGLPLSQARPLVAALGVQPPRPPPKRRRSAPRPLGTLQASFSFREAMTANRGQLAITERPQAGTPPPHSLEGSRRSAGPQHAAAPQLGRPSLLPPDRQSRPSLIGATPAFAALAAADGDFRRRSAGTSRRSTALTVSSAPPRRPQRQRRGRDGSPRRMLENVLRKYSTPGSPEQAAQVDDVSSARTDGRTDSTASEAFSPRAGTATAAHESDDEESETGDGTGGGSSSALLPAAPAETPPPAVLDAIQRRLQRGSRTSLAGPRGIGRRAQPDRRQQTADSMPLDVVLPQPPETPPPLDQPPPPVGPDPGWWPPPSQALVDVPEPFAPRGPLHEGRKGQLARRLWRDWVRLRDQWGALVRASELMVSERQRAEEQWNADRQYQPLFVSATGRVGGGTAVVPRPPQAVVRSLRVEALQRIADMPLQDSRSPSPKRRARGGGAGGDGKKDESGDRKEPWTQRSARAALMREKQALQRLQLAKDKMRRRREVELFKERLLLQLKDRRAKERRVEDAAAAAARAVRDQEYQISRETLLEAAVSRAERGKLRREWAQRAEGAASARVALIKDLDVRVRQQQEQREQQQLEAEGAMEQDRRHLKAELRREVGHLVRAAACQRKREPALLAATARRLNAELRKTAGRVDNAAHREQERRIEAAAGGVMKDRRQHNAARALRVAEQRRRQKEFEAAIVSKLADDRVLRSNRARAARKGCMWDADRLLFWRDDDAAAAVAGALCKKPPDIDAPPQLDATADVRADAGPHPAPGTAAVPTALQQPMPARAESVSSVDTDSGQSADEPRRPYPPTGQRHQRRPSALA
eukprot:TRINITY_DN24910_c0_g1_i1.p1 TRINITY_DN24910_c0_g1~~TRINITY_DN24910_c0_g1_i1.p1  ORF type:complete len:912 (+),score=258.38 TRINITY_DN24910_c0_g1_i1:54-2789(+)